MEHVTLRKGAKYFYIVFFLVISVLVFIMLRPFFNAILISIILAYIFFPIYRKLKSVLPYRNISSVVMVIIVLLIVIIPGILSIQLILQQFRTFSIDVKEMDAFLLGYIDDFEESLNLPEVVNLEAVTESLTSDLTKGLTDIITKFIRSIPFRILETFIVIFILFYLFRDGEKLLKLVKDHLPIKKLYKEELFLESERVVNAVIYGTLVAAVAQGAMGAIGFYIFGINNFLIWGLVMAILALFPFLGPAFIWVPASLFFLITGETTRGILLFIYGALLISSIDNIIKARIISRKARIHQALILLGLVGGIAAFGVPGIVIGPLVLSLLIVFLRVYLREKKTNNYS